MVHVSSFEFGGYLALASLALLWAILWALHKYNQGFDASNLADDSQVDYSKLSPTVDAPIGERTHTLRTAPTPRLNPRSCVLVEIDDEVQLSRLAKALAVGGLAISNTPRATLRIHPMKHWAENTVLPDNVASFPMPGRQAN